MIPFLVQRYGACIYQIIKDDADPDAVPKICQFRFVSSTANKEDYLSMKGS